MMRRTYIKKEAKRVRNEGAGAGMLINVGDIGGSQKITAFKANSDGTYTLDVDDVVLNDVRINTYEWSTPETWDGIRCKLSFTLEHLESQEKYRKQLQNRLAKMRTQPNVYGINTYGADIRFGTLSCGGGWSHMSLENGFDAEAYAADDLYNWRNMGSSGEVYVFWNSPDGHSIEDDFEIISVYVDAGTALEDLYQEGEDEWLSDEDEDSDEEDFSESRAATCHRTRKNEATDAATKASSAYYSLMNLFPRKSVNSSWMKCATPKELKSATWWNDLKAAINDISNMPGVTVEYRSENGAKTFAQFQKVVKSCANQYKYDDYELQLEQDHSNDRIFISGGLAAKLSWDEIIISFTSVQEARRIPRRIRKAN